MISKRKAATEVAKHVYGGTLDTAGRGFYVTLELLAVFWGVERRGVLPLDPDDPAITYWRRSHDFARRLVVDDPTLPAERREGVAEGPVLELVASVVGGLRLPVPFSKAPTKINSVHLLPYSGELIHYDTVVRNGAKYERDEYLSVERYAYRGGGTIAYDILKSDPDRSRIDGTRAGLRELVADAGGPLGELMRRLEASDRLGTPSELTDGTLAGDGLDRETKWTELLREGVARILATSTSRVKKVDSLLYWVPYAVARHQLELAQRAIGVDSRPWPIDFGEGGALRRESRRHFETHRRAVARALSERAAVVRDDRSTTPDDRPVYEELANPAATVIAEASAFYASTMAAVGGLNHNTGLRHYTLKLGLLESIVSAMVDPNEPVPFEQFCSRILYERLDLVVGVRSGEAAGMTRTVDTGSLRRNEQALGDLLKAVGAMSAYSDATRLVGVPS